MANLPEPLRTRVEQGGWVPIEFIGQGGGAKVYLCAATDPIGIIQKLLGARAVVAVPSTKEEAGHILKCLSTGLVRKKDALAALKVPLRLEDSTSFIRLKREIEAMRAVQHRALIRLLGVDEKNPPEWFAMEWHPSGTLSQSVELYKDDIVKSLRAILPIVDAVAHLHDAGFIHRDIKPSNIFIADEGHLVLGDLGITFPTEEEKERLTEVDASLVSRDWIPDWARFTDAPPERKVDVFMLAKVIYFMVTGGKNVLATQLDEEKFDLRHRLKEVEGAEDLQGVLLECVTTKEPQCKFANAGEFLVRLQELLNQLTGTGSGCLLFNFLSVHQSTHVVARKMFIPEDRRYPSLTNLQIFLPNVGKRIRARIRLIGPPERRPYYFFLKIDKHSLIQADGFPIETTLHPDQGTWVPEIVVSFSIPLDRGWHDLDVGITSASDGCFVTGFMLYVE